MCLSVVFLPDCTKKGVVTMKKVLAVILAAVICLMCAAPAALAADGYTKAHSVTVLKEQQKMFKVVPVDSDTNYVTDGGVFRFKIEMIGSYAENDATCYRAFAADTYYVDIINANEDNMADFTVDGKDRLIPDENGVYTVGSAQKGITCDIVIVSYNLVNKGGSSIINFLTQLGQFFTNLINWFFGLVGIKPGARLG